MARRSKREPFNPFAPGASNKSQKKVQKQRNEIVEKRVVNVSRQEQIEAMRRKIREKQEQREKEEKLKKDSQSIEPSEKIKKLDGEKISDNIIQVKEDVIKETKSDDVQDESKSKEIKTRESKVVVKPIKKDSVEFNKKQNEKEKPKQSPLSKLEDLKRRSDALAAKTGIKLPENDRNGTLFTERDRIKNDKKIKKTPKSVRKTKKGGGKQPKQQKLNRRKQLEFRFDARSILDNSDVAEEHRSNVFGQIWAKGERMGIQSAIEYISQKEEEGILNSDVSEELVALIKNYAIKR